MDDDGSKSLNYEEFKCGLNDFGMSFSASDVQEMFSYIDKDGSGTIRFDEFLQAIRVSNKYIDDDYLRLKVLIDSESLACVLTLLAMFSVIPVFSLYYRLESCPQFSIFVKLKHLLFVLFFKI